LISQRARFLLICPLFFGYHEAILGAARALGFEGHWVNARSAETTLYKASLKVAPRLVRGLTQRQMRAALSAVPDLVSLSEILIVKGDGLSAGTLDWLRQQAPQARVTLYMWDSVRNNPIALALAQRCDATVTFDSFDAAAHGWRYLPLFSRLPLQPPQDKATARYDWCFVGSAHGDRCSVLKRIMDRNRNLVSRVHCFVPSRRVQLARSLRDPRLLWPGKVSVATTPMSSADYQDTLAQSKAVVDIEHAAQTGLTMRTIETLLSGTKLITTNAHIRALDLFDDSRVLVISRKQPQIDYAFLDTPFAPIPPHKGQSYQIERWFASLLGCRVLQGADS
jgi:hypothetical protein